MNLAHLPFAVCLGAGTLIGATAMLSAELIRPVLLVQDQQKAVTITGKCIGSDGQLAAKLPVAVLNSKPERPHGGNNQGDAGNPDRLAVGQAQEQRGRWKVIGQASTDANGAFTIKNVREQGNLRVEVGDRFKSDWKIVNNVANNGAKPTIDLGEIRLDARVEANQP